MGHSLYVTYTQELKDHVTKLLDVARKAGWNDVVDGPGDSPYANSVARISQAQKADALIVVSAFAYGAEPGQSEQELIWDSFRSTGKPACALLLADSATWPIPWIEGFHRPERKPALEAFQSKLKRPSFFAVFGEKPDTIAEPARQQLQILRSALRAASEIKVFVVWDFTVTGLSMLLASLAKRPPEGFKLSVPGLEGGQARFSGMSSCPVSRTAIECWLSPTNQMQM